MSFTFKPPEFESHGGRLEAFYDGHCPETFRCPKNDKNENDALPPRIVRYDRMHQSSSTESSVHIYNDVLNPNASRLFYELTASDGQRSIMPNKSFGESPWGTYVTTTEALEWSEWKRRDGKKYIQLYTTDMDEIFVDWKQNMIRFLTWQKHHQGTKDKQALDPEEIQRFHNQLDDTDYVRHALAVEAVASFFIELIPSQSGSVSFVANSSSSRSTRRGTLYEKSSFLKQVHGVAVWALSSTAGQSVSYHIDYAELLRYEYNITVPPLWAGTIQCSNLMNEQKGDNDNARISENVMQGGEFCVNLRGLDHYSEHGYKGNLSGDAKGGWKRPEEEDAHAQCIQGDVCMSIVDQWVTIPYSFNRGIVHRGDLPHLSAPITSISIRENGIVGSSSKSRVIVGFNAFGHDVGTLIAKAPEHSKPFRRKVRMYRSTMNSCFAEEGKAQVQGGMDLSQLRQNKGLVKLLVLAKREKVKEELRRNQEQLSLRIWQRLISHHHQQQQHAHATMRLRISDIVNEFGSQNDGIDGSWPQSIDVHVHVHHMLVNSRAHNGATCNLFLDKDGMAGPPGVWYCMQAASVDASLSSSGTAKSMTEEATTGRLTPLSTSLRILPTDSNVNI